MFLLISPKTSVKFHHLNNTSDVRIT